MLHNQTVFRLLSCLLLASLFGSFCISVSAREFREQNLLIFHQDPDPERNSLILALKQQLPLRMPDTSFQYIDAAQLNKREIEEVLHQAKHCALGIGQAASLKMLSVRHPINYYSISVSRNLLNKLNRVYKRLGIFVSGIYQEQPFERQLFLSKAINPELTEVSILLEQSDKYFLSDYQAIAARNNIKLNYRLLKPADAPEKYLTQVADKNSFLLITNNQQLFMKSKLAALVLSAYYHQIKLIGSQYEDAKTGAVASLYTSPNTLAIETSNELKKICFNQEKPLPRFANSYNVVINQQIAENLNMNQLDANELSRRINQMESR